MNHQNGNPVGWISRIGFADNFIRELGLPIKAASYTLLPHAISKNSIILESLPFCRYLEIVCENDRLFVSLYSISAKIDLSLHKYIAAVNISFDAYGLASIKIFMRRNCEKLVQEKLSGLQLLK